MSYSPKSLSEVIGQRAVIQQIEQVCAAAKLKKTPLPHIMFTGPRGTGKTTIAKLVAKAMQQTIVLTAPSALQSNEDLFRLFSDNLDGESVTIFFIDEVHRLGVKLEEDLYLPMENSTFIRKGEYRGGYTMGPFSILAATTIPGKISEPMRDRFGLILHMEKYTVEDITDILRQAASKTGINITPVALGEIAKRARNNPRVANHLLDRCADYALVAGLSNITVDSSRSAFGIMGIDEVGLNETDRSYMRYLYEAGRPVSVQSLVPILDLDKETIQGVVEPYLIEVGFVSLTSRGRMLTQKGMVYVEQLSTSNGKNAMKMIGGS